ncbi:hypothetical protein Tco_1104331 [Tanacetum coccineum]
MAPRGRPTRTTRSRPVTTTPPPVTTTPPPVTDPTTTTSVTSAQLQAMIAWVVNDVLAARAATRNGDVNIPQELWQEGNERTIRDLPLGTLNGVCLTWWNSHAWTVTNDVALDDCRRHRLVVAYNQRFQELALLSDRMFPEEADKIERYVGGMPDPIYSSVVASKPKTMQEAKFDAWQLLGWIGGLTLLAENKRKPLLGATAPVETIIIFMESGKWVSGVARANAGELEVSVYSMCALIKIAPTTLDMVITLWNSSMVANLGLPTYQKVEFQDRSSTWLNAPVARAPYRLAQSEMKELAEQLQELFDLGFKRT